MKGMIDFHTHPSPDVVDRKFTDYELAERFKEQGLGGFIIKNHYFETASRAKIVQDSFPNLAIYGGIVLNRSIGGFNPEAVQKTAELGGKVVWMPTMDALSFQKIKNPTGDLASYLTVLDDDGKLLNEVYEIIEIVKEHDLVLSTGHLSAKEGIVLLRAASAAGVQKMVVTHADNCNNEFTLEEQRLCSELGAFIEHSYFMVYYRRTPIEVVAEQIKRIGSEKVILDTDFGQETSPYPDEGMNMFIDLLREHGVDEVSLERMTVKNPLSLLKS